VKQGKASEEGDREAKRVLETVQRKLLEKPDVELGPSEDLEVKPKKRVAPPSQAKQAKLVLHLSEFQEAIL
jgi:hypothetical protein